MMHLAWVKQSPSAGGPSRTAKSVDIYQQAASSAKALSWQHEFEADEVACAVLARLRVPPDLWTAGMEFHSARQLANMGSWIADIEEASQTKTRDGEQAAAEVAAMAAHMGWPSVDEGLAQLKAARAKGHIPLVWQQFMRWAACTHLQELLDAVDKGDIARLDRVFQVGRTIVNTYMIVGPVACPEPAVLAMLHDLQDTHPPTDVRIARIQHHLATQLPMLQRSTAPPVKVGGRFEPGSVAQAIADRAEAQLRAKSQLSTESNSTASGESSRSAAQRQRSGGKQQVRPGRPQGRRKRVAAAGGQQQPSSA
ncbi:hypothetical protein COHA_002204 [Chlorella ohadii]|uniref:Uncharacterized protein n=1 Tax=Chlorella ohadii TaxID=2649997 RepID=A0AAD5DU45_9CHLO|nr:hypothetical protein COHA_002204 [Chlorella ohadii]